MLLLFLDNIILHTIPKNIIPFQIRNLHPKLPIYQTLLLFIVYLPTQFMNLPLVINILLKNILPVLLPFIPNLDILLHLKARLSMLPKLLHQNIYSSFLSKNMNNKIQKNTYPIQT